MQITCNVQLEERDNFTETPQEVADGVLKACGGDEKLDTCNVQIVQPTLNASSGAPPLPPDAPTGPVE